LLNTKNSTPSFLSFVVDYMGEGKAKSIVFLCFYYCLLALLLYFIGPSINKYSILPDVARQRSSFGVR